MYKMNELSIKIVYSGFRKLTTRDVLMALNDYFRGAGQGDKMEIKSVSTPAVEAVAEIERQQEQIETLREVLKAVPSLLLRNLRYVYAHCTPGVENMLAVDNDNLRVKIDDLLEATKEQS